MDDFPQVLTIEEASKYLRIPLSTLYKLAQDGKIPCQKVGRHWRFRKETIDNWLDENRFRELKRINNLMQTIQDELLNRISIAPQQYNRLIILLNPVSQINDMSKLDIVGKLGLRYINLGLKLSQMLLDLTERQRVLKVPQLVDQIIGSIEDNPAILDHIEILFEPSLQQDPLRLLQGLSRNKTILAIWNGQVNNGYLTYASADHPEYRKYPIRELNILPLSGYSD